MAFLNYGSIEKEYETLRGRPPLTYQLSKFLRNQYGLEVQFDRPRLDFGSYAELIKRIDEGRDMIWVMFHSGKRVVVCCETEADAIFVKLHLP